MQKEKKGSFIKGAVIIAGGGFLAKIIGALYRIPLTNLIGGYGLGLYQMVYPVYCLLLTVSATGIPSSIAKLTAERVSKGEGDKPLLSTAFRLFLIIGTVGALLMMAIAPLLSKAQGCRQILGGYFALAPSVLLTSAISVFRGWFQGKNDMLPTALSEVCEQLVKVAFGLIFAYIFREQVEKAVTFLLLAVSLSELFALALMFALYKRVPAPYKPKNGGGKVRAKSVLKLSVPVTFSAMLLPLSALFDSVFAVRLMSKYAVNAVTLYGLFSGGAVTVINLPVSVCYGIAAASVPSVATAKAEAEAGKKTSVKKRLFFALGITALISAPCAVGLYYFAEPAVKIIYRSLQGEELVTLIRLIKAFSISALTLSCVQTLSACLTAQGKPQYSAISMAIAVIAKTATYFFLLKNPQVSVFGLAYATNLCYLIAFLLDLLYNLKVSKAKKEKGANDNGNRLRERQGRLDHKGKTGD